MSEEEFESSEEDIDESGRNPTQRQIDEQVDPGGEERKRWEETADEPHQGEEGQEPRIALWTKPRDTRRACVERCW
jgi:hypothetical protein